MGSAHRRERGGMVGAREKKRGLKAAAVADTSSDIWDAACMGAFVSLRADNFACKQARKKKGCPAGHWRSVKILLRGQERFFVFEGSD